MNFVRMLKSLVGKAPQSETIELRSIVIMQRKAHRFSESRIVPDAEAYASLAKLALRLGDPNCTAIFVPVKNIMMPNDGTAEEGLRLLINKELPLRR